MVEDPKSIDYMYKANDMPYSPHTFESSPEIDGTPITAVYRGWSSTPGGEGALRVVNGSDRQSVTSGAGTVNRARDSATPSELDSPHTPRRAGFNASPPQPVIAEQPYELAGQGKGYREGGT